MHATGTTTTNRGVQARELDIADTVDENYNSGRESGARASLEETHTVDETNSYIQVVVQKQKRARLPAASSPAPASPPPLPATHSRKFRTETGRRGDGGGEGEGVGLSEALLMLQARRPLLLLPPLAVAGMSPAPATLHNTQNQIKNEQPSITKGETGGAGDAQAPGTKRPQKKSKSWSIFRLDEDNLDESDCDPERFEVYYFESAEVSHLATCGARVSRVDRAARRVSRRAAALLADVLAAVRLLLAVPVHLLIAVLRCSLELQRSLVSGLVQTVSDQALKPALALLHNAVLQPPLACARAVLRPVLSVLGDVLAPLASVLGALRLVHVHVERECRCRCQPRRDDDNV